MKVKSLSRAVVASKKLRTTLTAALVSLLVSHPVQALPTSFPQYPLQTGLTGGIPPNVMLILDDSGSMDWLVMPDDRSSYSDTGNNKSGYSATPITRSYDPNVIYYNPENTYRPWRKATMPGDPDERMPNASVHQVSRHNTLLTNVNLNLKGDINSFFFIPKVANPNRYNTLHYDLYRISPSGQIQRCKRSNSDCTTKSPDSDWEAKLPPNNQGRNNAEEVQNYANWYHYHRTRMKMAKAGASEAFGQLDKNFRVGYDRINSNTRAQQNTVNKIVYPIPYQTNGGLFEGQNRIKFFNHLQAQTAGGGTPLRLALTRTGEYYKTDNPYKDSNGSLLSCRKNYAVLTTDGDWNGAAPRTPMAFADLVHIANYYWKNDLRKDLTDNVPTSAEDTAKHQHMNTFGISIGLGGSLSAAPSPTGGPWPQVGNKPSNKIDDLARAAGEGRGSFILANNTDQFADALKKALNTIGARRASGSNVATSSNKLEANTLSFSAEFNTADWLGDMEAKTIIGNDPQWRLSDTFNSVNANFSQRTVLTSYGNSAQLFNKTTMLDSVFARASGGAPVSAADNIDYLRGVQTLEGKLRSRKNPIGDIVNSHPFYVPDTHTVYVGANDGMLHGINADDGKVLFSYVPKGIDFAAMSRLSSPNYEHRFFVDGYIDVSSNNITKNKNILLAALGRGGRGVFALDVSNPDNMGTLQVLWDHTTQDTTSNPNMGHVLGRMRIRAGNGDKIWAFVPNGIESPNGKSVLFAYELNVTDGSIKQTHELLAGEGPDNGLMSLGFADTDGNGTVDVVYGGDLKGNVWRWDFSTENPADATLLFKAVSSSGQAQPITGGLTVGRNPNTGDIFVGFGTGRLISENDKPKAGSPARIQSIYGLIDSTTTIQRADLQERKLVHQKPPALEAYALLDINKKGWYLDLPSDQRVISDPAVEAGEALKIAAIVVPVDGSATGCESAAGSGYIYGINLFTGTSPSPLGNNPNGYFPSLPKVTLKDGTQVPVAAVSIEGGMPTSVNVVCDESACKVVVESGAPRVEVFEGSQQSQASVSPHRMQWRSLR